jgi:hypothetical protein
VTPRVVLILLWVQVHPRCPEVSPADDAKVGDVAFRFALRAVQAVASLPRAMARRSIHRPACGSPQGAYAAYFLTVHDIVAEARSRGILCQGRGSAAKSILCYLLGITDVSPDMIGMVLERFISRHRGETPDIDFDFEHERREEIIQWIYEKYGRERAGLCATVIHFRSRAAIREVGKVMGLSQDVTASLSGQIWGMSNKGADPDRIRELGLNAEDRRLS